MGPVYTNSLPWQGLAVSSAADLLRKMRDRILDDRNAAASLSAPIYAALNNLEIVTAEMRESINESNDVIEQMDTSKSVAQNFLELLPPKYQNADFLVEPDGSVAMEWRPAKGRVLIVSFVAPGRVEYAGLDGITNRFHGPAMFVDRIPEKIIEQLERLRLN